MNRFWLIIALTLPAQAAELVKEPPPVATLEVIKRSSLEAPKKPEKTEKEKSKNPQKAEKKVE